jgi:signal transduction histidine kinase
MRARVAGITLADLSERVPLPAADDAIGRLASTMNGMLARLEHAQRAQRAFVADASHELRSPLATIRATIEVSQGSNDSTEWTATGNAVLAETERLEKLVGDLLLLARADEDGLVALRMDVDVDDILIAEQDRLRRTTTLAVVADVEPCRVSGDRRQLERLVRNLCDNAARYAVSTVTLGLRHGADHHVVIVVADDGPGVPPESRGRIFERFVRLDTSRDRSGGGSGLGLAIVDEVARAHGGAVAVTDAEPGARFEVRLPAVSRPDRPSSGIDGGTRRGTAAAP